MNPLEQRIGFKFRNSLLLAEALTHSSLSHETQRRHFDNQRLEFLGDAVLQLIFTEELYRRFPQFTEGQMTKLRSKLVSRAGLSKLAERIDLGRYLLMGRGEEACGGRSRSSILADAFEGLIGAMYIDSNLDAVRRFILDECSDLIESCTEELHELNPKGQLQELLQAVSKTSPTYEAISEEGPEHQKVFVVAVKWMDKLLAHGTGASKKIAETNAARNAMESRLWEVKQPKKQVRKKQSPIP